MTTTLATRQTTTLAIMGGYRRIAQLAVDAVDSPHTKRAYERALVDFLDWHEAQGRPTLSKATVQEYRTHLLGNGMAHSSVNQRLTAIRKFVSEAADNELMPEEAARGIGKIKGVRVGGTRSGNWLSKKQAQRLLNTPDTSTLKGLRDRAILAVLVGCGLRRQEAANLTFEHLQRRSESDAEGREVARWVIINLVGKRNKMRSVPMPTWAKTAIDEWAEAAGIASGHVFRSVNRGDNLSGHSMTAQAIRDVVVTYTAGLDLGDIAPHDLRRTFARLARDGGAPLEQIQLSLGHASVKTTEIYLGTKQTIADAPCDRLGLSLG